MFPRTLVSAVALCGALWASGCTAGNCGETTSEINGPDGGVWRCAQPEDCPRSSNQEICAQNRALAVPCVSCTDTRCVLHQPDVCG